MSKREETGGILGGEWDVREIENKESDIEDCGFIEDLNPPDEKRCSNYRSFIAFSILIIFILCGATEIRVRQRVRIRIETQRCVTVKREGA